MFCHPIYDVSIADFMDEFIHYNLNTQTKDIFIRECIIDLLRFDYSVNDHKITDKFNLYRYMLDKYSIQEIFLFMNSKQASMVIKELENIDFINDMMPHNPTLEDMLCLYYIAYLHINKKRIIEYLLTY